MASGITFELHNSRELAVTLERASVAVKAAIARANRETAFAVLARAQALAPRRSGDLARSINAQPVGRAGSWKVGILDVTIPSRGGRNSAHLHPWVYGVWYEFGFVSRRIERHPFMGPASQAEVGPHEARIAKALTVLSEGAG